MLRLTMNDLRVAHSVLAEVFEDDPEPIPDWERANPHSLATCRACIEVEAFGAEKYPDLPSAAAKLFYSTIKLHPFPNGNKRFALVLTIFLLVKNGQMLTADTGVGADAAKAVALSDPHAPETTPDKVIDRLIDFFRDNIKPYDEAMRERGRNV